ncbi:type IV secretion system protein [Sphingomonas sp.]|uniref:type IV secretion system protein n=1 Tax=Sphingomonas sp. TaxID=28214 RepID=UPI001B106BFA|nr:type IV secretion system protein [Sphingomonas sp.]MBO9712263.1 type IV secretion system protein [Sphingomonas sp.]
MICRPLSYGDGFVRGMLDFVDCQAQNIGEGGYHALAAPGSGVSIALTAMLTIVIALYGYRMLLGHTPSARDGVITLVKIGVVLALATSWSAYRTLAYDVALRGPAQVAGEIGGSTGLPGSQGGLVGRLQGVDAALILLNEYGVGKANKGQTVTREKVVNGKPQLVVEPVGAPPDLFEVSALGWSRIFFLVGTIGALAAVRLVSGLLLALGPLFIAFLLFEGTRGLFEGWVRALAGASLGALAVTLVLGAELALVEPWLAYLLAMRQADLGITGAPVEIFVVMLVFALVLAGAIFATAKVAAGFRLPKLWRTASEQVASALRGETAQARTGGGGRETPAAERSRAVAVAEAVAAAQRREVRVAAAGGSGSPSRLPAATGLSRDVPTHTNVPLGQSQGRRARNRATGSAGRRDRR